MQMNIDQLQPGPEFDRLIAEEVMGWTVCEDDNGSLWLGTDGIVNGWAFSEWRDTDDPEMTDICRCEFIKRWMPRGVFRPSVDWAAAGVVFEKMPELGHFFSLFHGRGYDDSVTRWEPDGFTVCVWYPNGKATLFDSEADTAPLAICRAALKVVTNG